MRLHELKLPIGKTVSITIIGQDYKEHQFDAQIMGYQQGESVALALLAKPGQVLLRAGLKLSVKGTQAFGHFSFESEIEAVANSPFLYLMAEYPVAVKFTALRAHARIKVDTPVEVNAHTALGMTTTAIHGVMLDVSDGGARLVLEKELTSMVTQISVGVQLTGQRLERDMTLLAKIRNKAALSAAYPECGFAYGVEFIDFDPIDELFLRCFTLQQTALDKVLEISPAGRK